MKSILILFNLLFNTGNTNTQYIAYDKCGNIVYLDALPEIKSLNKKFINDNDAIENGLKFGEYYVLSHTNTYGFTPMALKEVGYMIFDSDKEAAKNGVKIGEKYGISPCVLKTRLQ